VEKNIMNAFIQELKQRGLVSQMTDETKISDLMDNGLSLYCGFDPTAESLHVGSLLPLITMLRFKKAGHTVFPLIGGATGMIGDPSFKAQERTLNDAATVNRFKAGIAGQIKSILGDVELVDNHDWTVNLSIIDFLRDVGKHFSVNAMMSKDSVRSRLERDDQGISFTEFSYQLLQSMDFHHLLKAKDCRLQLGGSDQWGNITAGIDLIHRKEGNDVVATGLTIPLLTKADGTKFGKSESGAVWLSSEMTSPFDFFQFWLKVADADIPKFFKMLSFKSIEEIDAILEADKERTKPMAQQLLAEELTLIVHGQAALDSVLRNIKALFDNNFDNLQEDDFINLEKNGMVAVVPETLNVLDLMVATGLAKSKRQGREFIQSGAVQVNGNKLVVSEDDMNALEITDFKFGKFAVFQRGKREFRLIKKPA
jgi:tyrosyl-tRNA synthetase